MIQKLLENQEKIQKQLGTNVKDIQFLRNMALATIIEISEVINESPWKPWKPENYKEVDFEKVLGELADVQIFVFNMLLHYGVNMDQLSKAISIKQQININRFINDGVWNA